MFSINFIISYENTPKSKYYEWVGRPGVSVSRVFYQKSQDIACFYAIRCTFGDLYCDFVDRKRSCLGCTKLRNPGIGTVLHPY